jgi:chemotaxis family two-component system response regulator Rcp1
LTSIYQLSRMNRDRILLYVEDEDAAVFLFETAMKEAAIELQLFRVCDGEEAIAFLGQTGSYTAAPRPGLILLDLNLPRRSGFEVLAQVQRDASLGAIPIVVFTASSLASDRQRSLALGARQYITKPATFDGFVDAVKAVSSYLPQQDEATT